MNIFHHALLASNKDPFQIGSTPALQVSQVSANSIFWAHIYKSSEFPEINTTKPYFILYSTDHDTGAGGIWWGEFDDFDNVDINGFIERGLIISGDQAETPYLLRVPSGESGVTTDPIFLYYHTDTSEVGNNSKQQTRLITTTGGDLHSATWTDRGRPLGIVAGENHTGYFTPKRRGANDYIGDHVYDGTDYTGGKVSTSSDPATGWTRLVQYTGEEGMPVGGAFYRTTIQVANRNSKVYGVFRYLDPDGFKYIALAELDSSTYLPTTFIKKLYKFEVRDITSYVEGDFMYLLAKEGTQQPDTNDYYLFIYDLKDLDKL